MNLDLTGLAEIAQPAAGEPLLVPLDAIRSDPNQPREHFDEATLQELAESIRAIGIVQPISVRPDPDATGRYIINYGERRYRASMIANMRTIPVFVHKAPDDYAQITENLHRADLSPMELALFISKRVAAGERRSKIAAKLGYKRSFVTEHLALLEAPACVEKAFVNGVSSARTLYDLRKLHDEFPEQVDTWFASGAEVTRETIAAFAQSVRHDEHFVRAAATGGCGPTLSAEPALLPDIGSLTATTALETKTTETKNPPSFVTRTATAPSSNAPDSPMSRRSDMSVGSGSRSSSSTKRLLIKVEHGDRRALVQDDSVVRIRYDDGGTAEVRLADTVVLGTTSA